MGMSFAAILGRPVQKLQSQSNVVVKRSDRNSQSLRLRTVLTYASFAVSLKTHDKRVASAFFGRIATAVSN